MSTYSYVRVIPETYNIDFIKENVGAIKYTLIENLIGSNGETLIKYSFDFDSSKETELNSALMNYQSNYDSDYIPWTLPKYTEQVMMRMGLEFYNGFTVPTGVGGPLAGNTLQTRDNDDRTNWLTSQAAYLAQINAGNGEVVGASFRTANNVTISCTFQDGYSALLSMASWGASIFHRSWQLKDQLSAATTKEELDAVMVDLNNGWPSSIAA